MSATPSIVVSAHDFERLDQLLTSLASAGQPGVAALRGELARARVVEPQDMPPDVVTMNSRARLLNESSGRMLELTLVYPKDADVAAGRVSVLAPVGSALLGLGQGQSIDWPMPGGQQERLKVLEVLFQPEAAGLYHV